MSNFACFQWLNLGYYLELIEKHDILAFSVQMEYVSRFFLKTLEKKKSLKDFQSDHIRYFCGSISDLPKVSLEVQELHSFEGLFVQFHQIYYGAFTKLLLYCNINLSVPFQLDIYTDDFMAHRFQQQYRVLGIAASPPSLKYNHLQKKVESVKSIPKSDLKKEIIEALNNCKNISSRLKVYENWDKFASGVANDLIETFTTRCNQNLEAIDLDTPNLKFGKYLPYLDKSS
eukprot:NODE_15_length_50561_cov_0.608081.p25 type:complete len:230 gc:universal NODE_15_length_50561_cov_0.608081:46726-46037(-)